MLSTSKTIVLWGREDILSSSVEFFLASKKDWNVINISNEKNVDDLILAVKTMHPDIVIIPQGGNDPANLPMELLRDHPGLKVITISLDNNSMEMYSKQNILVKEALDLISVIENQH